ncbi:lipid-A-disaccharide kinase [Cnuella takakiae]|uniref:Tetraacyldisaccharide 4'-kinase n=1 Tax=Cnuella takakiae TaxID=1302690 RepID=A0A1M4XRG3_9BACT|nr:tetraacyldisaccharide 4'-kinase [Cnuella takakiae]OLY92915.1 tetraacyldisaccharide 4'-kinase [Cnuella takakiae]SHE96048.1 lipid-A-disaccharide kinase [Cnuella takakiae]
MFFDWFLKSFRILLLPFALLYGFIVVIRNWLYDKKILRSANFGLPLICVGNLSVGGTGKSPMVELLVRQLTRHFKVATLSRGYKRKTRGYALATENTTAIDIGDEPMQFHRKFPGVPVAVGEERIVAIPQLLHDRPDTEVVILDDAFQHRAIKPGLNILLTDCGNLYTRDFFLPAGDLRDSRHAAGRADIIVVTKCPAQMGTGEAEAIRREISPREHQQLYFTTIAYGMPYHITHMAPVIIDADTEVLLVTGIANPKPLKTYLEDQVHTYHLMQYGDHHIFTIDDFRDIKKRFENLTNPKKIILTTEKDAMRLEKFASEINGMPFSVLPIEHRFLFEGEHRFIETVVTFIKNFKKPE